MKMFIPACGTRIQLLSPWTFMLHHESRNERLFKFLSLQYEAPSWKNNYSRTAPANVTIPSDVLLEVDRVYIRANSKSAVTADDSYDSVSFKIIEWPGSSQDSLNVSPAFCKGIRFWAKLSDVNIIEFTLPDNALYRDRPEAIKKAKKLKPAEMMYKVCNVIGWGYSLRYGWHKDNQDWLSIYSIQNDAIDANSGRQLREMIDLIESRNIEPDSCSVHWQSKFIEKGPGGIKREFRIKEIYNKKHYEQKTNYWIPADAALKAYVITIQTNVDDTIMTKIEARWE